MTRIMNITREKSNINKLFVEIMNENGETIHKIKITKPLSLVTFKLKKLYGDNFTSKGSPVKAISTNISTGVICKEYEIRTYIIKGGRA